MVYTRGVVTCIHEGVFVCVVRGQTCECKSHGSYMVMPSNSYDTAGAPCIVCWIPQRFIVISLILFYNMITTCTKA